jgi:hypothetical protein
MKESGLVSGHALTLVVLPREVALTDQEEHDESKPREPIQTLVGYHHVDRDRAGSNKWNHVDVYNKVGVCAALNAVPLPCLLCRGRAFADEPMTRIATIDGENCPGMSYWTRL